MSDNQSALPTETLIVNSDTAPAIRFEDLGLAPEILRALNDQGYVHPTPIQAEAIPIVLKGIDLMGAAQTGTGKTAGFSLPIIQLLLAHASASASPARHPVRALILTPTRELADQVAANVKAYCRHTPLRSLVVFGGIDMAPQTVALRNGVEIVIATPGRLLDHVQQKSINLSQTQILVMDEADRMLDMGFIKDIRRVLAVLPKNRQNLLFSATFSNEIKALAEGLLNSPAVIEVARRNSTVEVIEQKIHPVDRDKKHPMLAHLIKTNNWSQVLVFTRTKHGANKLVEQLAKDEISGMAIHGNKSQSARTKALSEFKDGKLQVLVATDIAARGIDIDQLPHVVNYDLPNVPEDYVHRIGRTGRAGATGEAVSLVCVDELDMLKDIEKLIKRKLVSEVIPGFEPDLNAKPQPIQRRSADHQQNRRPQQGRGNAPAKSAKTPGAKPSGPNGQARSFGGNSTARPAAPHRSGGRGR